MNTGTAILLDGGAIETLFRAGEEAAWDSLFKAASKVLVLQSLSRNSLPRSEECLKGASRRAVEAQSLGSCFETPPPAAPQHEGFGFAAGF
jgi:hypothetical protein